MIKGIGRDITATDIVAPVAIDLNGDGIDYLSVNHSTAHFDYHNDGLADQTAWVGPEDGLLV
ncbi:MAG: hypothetical protein HQL49_11315, partial [Gammaproteobacteria bacterium]|nr:hypothetical protein [Gammaproteobacteria bacterium]